MSLHTFVDNMIMFYFIDNLPSTTNQCATRMTTKEREKTSLCETWNLSLSLFMYEEKRTKYCAIKIKNTGEIFVKN